MAKIGAERKPIVEYLLERAQETPDKPAIISSKHQRSYGEIVTGAYAVANWLHSSGHRPGQPVLFSAENTSTLFPSFYFGIHLRNGIAVPVRPRVSDEELEQLSAFIGPNTAIVGDTYAEVASLVTSSSSATKSLINIAMPSADDLCEIIFTTGTTGRPKGVALTHGNTSASASMIREFVGNKAHDTEVVTVPLTHSFGIGRVRASVLAGGTVVLVPGLTFPQLVINALRENFATGLIAVPAGMEILLRNHAAALEELSGQIRYIEMGSAPLRRKSKEMLCRIFPTTRVCMHYGMTEASRSTFLEFHSDNAHLDTVGRPSPGVEISILNDQGDSSSLTQEHGKIMIRAATVMSGYWNEPELTRKSLRPDGWLVTNDEGSINENGYLTLLGRSDDVINTGAEKVRAEQIEDIVRAFPGIHDCGCTGIPDTDGILGELPLICVEADAEEIDTSALLRFVSEKTDRKVQKAKIQCVDRLPRTESGKLLRKKLAKLVA